MVYTAAEDRIRIPVAKSQKATEGFPFGGCWEVAEEFAEGAFRIQEGDQTARVALVKRSCGGFAIVAQTEGTGRRVMVQVYRRGYRLACGWEGRQSAEKALRYCRYVYERAGAVLGE